MLLSDQQIEDYAQRLRLAYEDKTPVSPFGTEPGFEDPTAAYAVQERNTIVWLAQGRRLTGRKIGLTSPAVQEQLGVDQPDFGMLYADMEVESGAAVRFDGFLQPKVEGEVAFELARDLAGDDITAADVVAAIAFARPAIEIVDSRIADWRISFADTVADNASSGGYVLGEARVPLPEFEPAACGMTMTMNGAIVSEGNGRACMGDPLNAALWLAQTMAEVGRPLRAGDVILSGALGPMASPKAGDRVEVTIDGLGSAAVSFE
ncbi:MAG: fumarylacetoacetate hydrolase family protein [Pseudomonadota bacterium]